MKQKDFLNYLIVVFLAISFFISIYLPFEFMVTEIWMITPRLSPLIGTLFLFFLVVLLSLANWQKIMAKRKTVYLFFSLILFLSLFIYQRYHQQKLILERLPKIYSISPPEWGFQASEVEIWGKNFFPAHRQGRVFIGGQKLIIEKWSDDYILTKQQVPREFGNVKLYLIREDGVMSNKVSFEIKDPDELLNKY